MKIVKTASTLLLASFFILPLFAGEATSVDIDGILDRLVQKNWEMREKLIKEIKVLPTDGLYAGLKPAVIGTEVDQKRRLAAMAVAAARSLPEAKEDFLTLSGDANEEIRLMAVLCLGWLKDPSLLPDLEQFAKGDSSTDIRVAAIESIDRTGAVGATSTLHDLLGPGERNVRISALYVLGAIADPASLEEIRPLTDDPDAQVRRYAMSVLRKFDNDQDKELPSGGSPRWRPRTG